MEQRGKPGRAAEVLRRILRGAACLLFLLPLARPAVVRAAAPPSPQTAAPAGDASLSDGTAAAPESGRTATLRVVCSMESAGGALAGLSVEVFRVAAFADGTAAFSPAGAFVPCGVDFAALTTAARQQAAAVALLRFAAARGISGAVCRTDGGGQAVFSGLQTGLYLVAPADKDVSAAGSASAAFEPFFAALPLLQDGRLLYEVTAQPKCGRTAASFPSAAGGSSVSAASRADSPRRGPFTGESGRAFRLLGCLLAAALCGLFLHNPRRSGFPPRK